MTGVTTGQLALATCTDSDDTENFLTVALATVEQHVDDLFHSSTGHNHNGTGEGAPIGSGGIASGIIGTAQLAANAVTQIGANAGSTSAPTTTNTSYADIPEMTVTLTTTGGSLLCIMSCTVQEGAGGDAADLGLSLDGAAEIGIQRYTSAGANVATSLTCLAWITGVSAASHTIKGRWKVTGGTWTATLTYRQIIVAEIKR